MAKEGAGIYRWWIEKATRNEWTVYDEHRRPAGVPLNERPKVLSAAAFHPSFNNNNNNNHHHHHRFGQSGSWKVMVSTTMRQTWNNWESPDPVSCAQMASFGDTQVGCSVARAGSVIGRSEFSWNEHAYRMLQECILRTIRGGFSDMSSATA